MELLTANELMIQYENGASAVAGVSLALCAGTVTVILGPSGAGKSTLLRGLAGLQPLAGGTVLVGDQLLDQLAPCVRAQQIGFVSQDYQLFPHMTVIRNCTHAPLKVLGRDADTVHAHAEQLLGQLGVSTLAMRYPHQLSGGQQQRVAIARALAMGSRLLLFDEPTSALDAHNVEALAELLKALCDKGYAIVVATHDLAFASQVLDRVVILREGAVFMSQESVRCDAESLKAMLVT